MKSFLKIARQKRGQSLIEYLILVCLVAVGTMGIVRVVGGNVAVHFANVAKALGTGDTNAYSPHEVEASMYKKKDLTNFLEGSKSSTSNGNSGRGGGRGRSSSGGGGGPGGDN